MWNLIAKSGRVDKDASLFNAVLQKYEKRDDLQLFKLNNVQVLNPEGCFPSKRQMNKTR